MRLIDADELKVNCVCLNAFCVDGRTIENAPTVEAIPVEWLIKRAELCTADYANCLHYSVEAWQTEQKYMVNGQWKFPKDGEEENGRSE